MDFIVVGAGWAGQHHVQAIQALQAEGVDARVAGLVDTDAEHLARCAAEWGIEQTFGSLEVALDALPDAAAVVLATPHHLHREGTEPAAAAGRRVLVEKPMALTLEDADAMIAACRDADVTLMVLESARYSRPSQAVAAAIAEGKIGQVLSGRMNRIPRGRHDFSYPGRRAWLADPAAGGSGMWMLNGIHAMSRARMFFGEVRRIYAREVHSGKFESDLEATVVAVLEFDSGAAATVTLSSELHGYKRYSDLVIFGADGTLGTSDRDGGQLRIDREDADSPEIIDCTDPPRGGAGASFVRQMEEFLAAIAEGREPATGGVSERASLAVVVAGYESMRTGRPVEIQAGYDTD